MLHKLVYTALLLLPSAGSDSSAVSSLVPAGETRRAPVPSSLQLEWQEMEIGAQITWSLQSSAVDCMLPNATRQRTQNGNLCFPTQAAFMAQTFPNLNVSLWLEVARSFGAKYSFAMASQWSGLLLHNSSTHNFSMAYTGYGRDIFAEYVAESARIGMRCGAFYSNDCNHYLGVAAGKAGAASRMFSRMFDNFYLTRGTACWHCCL